ncbi:1285_t:CDS:2, partial [Scutellospora calospora]
MSAITTKIVEKYKLTSNIDISELSQYTSDNEQVGVLIPNQRSGKNKTINIVKDNCRIVLASPQKNLEEEIIREKAKQILQNRYGFSKDQVNTLFTIQTNRQCESTS